jgi:hypothetical protein
MRLRQLVEEHACLSEDATLFVERIEGKFTPQSRALPANIPEALSGRPIREIASELAPGLVYFLEVSIIRELVEGWSQNHQGATPSTDQALESIIYYAENDAYPDSFFG